MNYYNLAQYFTEISVKYNKKIALKYLDKSYTYDDINNRAEYFSSILFSLGFSQGDVLCIVNTKEKDAYIMMLACLKIGVAYVNLDRDNPIVRTESIINRCQPKGVFDDSNSGKFNEICSEKGILILNTSIDIDSNDLPIYSNVTIDGNAIAYIMFTSGSTGEPKGVAVTHQNVLHLISWIEDRYEISSKDNFANLSPMYFDNSVFDFYGALFNGASLTPIKKELFENPKKVVDFITEMKCTIWFSVPSLLVYLINMKVMTIEVLQQIRIFTFGGEGFPKSNLKKLFDVYKNSAKLVNVYGPTEGTCICSSYDITEKDFDDMSELPSLGVINPNFSFVIESLENAKDNEGELIIIGPNIASGYYNFPEKTAESFGVFQSGKYNLNRFYRTGDLVKLKGELLYFVGRKDNQIKHMGYRIELEEIENAINKLSYIQESGVIYKRINDSYGKIIAFIVSDNNEQSIIKTELEKLIPHYMVPNNIIFMEILPKNANGKIDRNKLKEL